MDLITLQPTVGWSYIYKDFNYDFQLFLGFVLTERPKFTSQMLIEYV